MENESLSIVALGANLPSSAGDPACTLRAALAMLHAEPNISIRNVSCFWQTAAYPPGFGPDYCNTTAILSSNLTPSELLQSLHVIEARFGRSRDGGRWQSRPLDLDLIACGSIVLPDPQVQKSWRELSIDQQTRIAPSELILPHPRMQDRGFVLAPLAEIAPDWRHPLTGRTVTQMLASLDPADWADMQRLSPALGR